MSIVPDTAYEKNLKRSIRRQQVAWDAGIGWYYNPLFLFELEARAQVLLRQWCTDGVITVDQDGKVRPK